MPDVRWPEISIGSGRHHRVLRSEGRRAPESEFPAMVAIGEHHERLLVANEPGWLAMAEPFGGLRKRQAHCPESFKVVLFVHGMSLRACQSRFYSLRRTRRIVRP